MFQSFFLFLTILFSQSANALIGGTPSDDFLSAVAFPDASIGCSAVKIGAYRYLLAGHCVNYTGFNQTVNVGDTVTIIYRVMNENKKSDKKEVRVTVSNVRAHATYIKMIQEGTKRTATTYDLATIDIKESVRDVPSISIFNAAPKKGQIVYLTGYGCERYNADPTFNFKIAKKRINRIEPPIFVVSSEDENGITGSGGCVGDSGSASYVKVNGVAKLIGINSYSFGFLGLKDEDNTISFEQNVATDIVRLDSPAIRKWIYAP
jgi:hypothetical protein